MRKAMLVLVLIYLLTIIIIMLGVKDLCQADSKSFSMQWSLLLPTSDALQLRYSLTIVLAFINSNFYYHVSRAIWLLLFSDHIIVLFAYHRMRDATLMTCLLFDPCLKVMTSVDVYYV
jgi:hypothetical protein